ncbi:MAG: SRPBCC domain-containing protein [Alphaproteobacteria bacterium]|nr:SRPBCC domain-containing protein [Alphaproteobacteria bacterium]
MSTATATEMDLETRTLRMERVFKATPQRVFDAFTKPEQVAAWWGPEGMHVARLELNTVESGVWFTVMENGAGEQYHVSGRYLVIDPPKRLVFTWAWTNDGVRGHETEVELTFTETEAGCRLNLVQTVFENQDWRDDHNGGWTSSLNCLDVYLASE